MSASKARLAYSASNVKDSGFRYAVGVYKNDAFGATGNDENDRLTLAITGRATWSSAAPGDVIHLGAWHSYRDMGGNELGERFATCLHGFYPL